MIRRARVVALLAGAALIATAAVAASCTVDNHVRLSFGDQGDGLLGFECTPAGGGQPILARALPSAKINVVVDFIPLASDPGARSAELIGYCSRHACTPLAQDRTCIPGVSLVGVSGSGAGFRASLATVLENDLAGTPLVSNAPDGPVLVRVVGTVESCTLLDASGGSVPSFDPSKLVGCAYGGPAHLDSVRGDLFVGFDEFVSNCEPGVDVCAGKFSVSGF